MLIGSCVERTQRASLTPGVGLGVVGVCVWWRGGKWGGGGYT